MATARDGTNPYGDGLGVGGKFKKRPFHRSTQSTPYVRPPTAVRNPNGNGWLSKLVDPAQRLIASGAHKLFASVFRKRLPPPPPPPPIIERTDKERMENHQEATLTGSPGSRDGVIHQLDKPSSSADVSEFNELEQILKKKTFTRLEIDRLTILLHSRSADNPNAVGEKLPEVPIKVSQEKKEHYPNTMLKEVMDDQFISTPLVSQAVADEDVASPAELAKAYMGRRPSKVSSSIQNFGNQALVVGSRMPSNEILTSKSPKMSLVARHSGYAGGIRDGFATPRSRGRSAIYNMARTPYSRVQSVAKLKGGGLTSDGGPSSSSSLNQNVLEQGRLSASKQGASKRTSSVLENDIGSFGPIRRIRHKSNLLSPKNLSLSPPTSKLSINEPGLMLDIRHPLSHVQNPASSREVKFTQTIGENDVMDIPGPSFTAVRSKSSETASKILKHLDMLVSTREKSPAKMSASMLSGQALRSLENVESPKYLESPVAKNKVDETRTSTVGVQDTTLNRRDGSPMKLLASINDSVPAAKSVNTGKPVEDGMLGVEVSGSSVTQTSANLHQGKKWAFHMSAHEDIVEVDDDDRLNGVASTLELESREKLNVPDVQRKNIASESLAIEKSAASEVKQLQNSEHKSDPGTPNGSEVVEKTAVPTFITSSSSVVNKASSKESYAAPTFNVVAKSVPKETNATVPASTSGSADIGKFSLGIFTSFASQSEKSVCATSIAVGDSDPPKVPESNKASKDQVENFVLPQNAVSSPASTSSSCGTIFSFSATSNNSSLMNGSLATSTFSFASHAVAPVSSVFTGKSSSDRSAPSVLSAAVSATAFSAPTTHSPITGGSSSGHAPAPSPTCAPVFNIASSVVASTSASTLTTNSGEQTAVRIKDSGFGNLMSASFGSSPASSTPVNLFNSGVSSVTSFAANSSSGATSAATVGTDSSIFSGMSPSFPNIADSIPGGTSSAAGSTSSNASSGATLGIASTVVPGTSTVGSTGSNIFGFSASAASSATTSSLLTTSATVGGISAQSMPIQFGSSASSPSFATSGNASSSGSALFSSSAPAGNLFSSGSSYVLSSSSGPSAISASSFSSGWEAPKSPFVSAFPSSASSGFTFGGTSASVAVVSTAPSVFGSTTGASSSSPFSFASVAAVTSAPSLPFGGGSPSFTFGSSPSNNNDQMEDSMAEDTVQASAPAAPLFGQQASQAALPVGSVFGQPNQAANPVAPIFGQQPNQAATPAASIFGQQPSSAGFVFGATPPSLTGNQNPVQFGSQHNTGMVQNSAPFQASGSIGAGGSFSLGSSGGDKSNRKIVRVNRNKLRKK